MKFIDTVHINNGFRSESVYEPYYGFHGDGSYKHDLDEKKLYEPSQWISWNGQMHRTFGKVYLNRLVHGIHGTLQIRFSLTKKSI